MKTFLATLAISALLLLGCTPAANPESPELEPLPVLSNNATIRCGSESFTAFEEHEDGGHPADHASCDGEVAVFRFDENVLLLEHANGTINVTKNDAETLVCEMEWSDRWDCGSFYVAVGRTEEVISAPMAPAFRDHLESVRVLATDFPYTTPDVYAVDDAQCSELNQIANEVIVEFMDKTVTSEVYSSRIQMDGGRTFYFGTGAEWRLTDHETLYVFTCQEKQSVVWHYQP